MQDFEVIIGVISMRLKGHPYELCQQRYGIGTGTVTRIMNRYKALGLSAEDLRKRTPDEVERLFYPDCRSRRKKIPLPNYGQMYERMTAKNSRINMTYLWLEYKKANPDGYEYTQFVHHFNDWVVRTHGAQKTSMIVSRKAGERMYVDWVGDQPELLVTPEGEVRKVHIFCATLGVSSLGYAEVFEDETLPSFVQGIVNAIEYFGGVPRYIACDNLKTAVTKHTKDELVLTSLCRDLENFYEVVFLPGPPYKPRSKSTVESFVGVAETYYAEPLKENVFRSVSEINDAGRPLLEKINSWSGRGRKASRRELFEKIDQPALRPLPDGTFTVWKYVPFLKIPATYHLPFDGHLYSVPYQYAGQPAVLRASRSRIRITASHDQLIAEHQRRYDPFPEKITVPDHLAPNHRFYAEVNEMDGARWRAKADEIGEPMRKFIECVLSSAVHEEQMYESCASIFFHAGQLPKASVLEAASFCTEHHICAPTQFIRIASAKANDASSSACGLRDSHANLRGRSYYK